MTGKIMHPINEEITKGFVGYHLRNFDDRIIEESGVLYASVNRREVDVHYGKLKGVGKLMDIVEDRNIYGKLEGVGSAFYVIEDKFGSVIEMFKEKLKRERFANTEDVLTTQRWIMESEPSEA